ncbi:uncharacterized protein SCHCODRAFT_02540355 [Schizophyllum commune H4-8]|nr:uncharacterized protein SCHCODRAFT_02540355 [Schizophyllum commune H4-8]KAI5894151.1 hypothetical protein SCHCODRAFT_02540355 [Schizophyllum commune H4-8]
MALSFSAEFDQLIAAATAHIPPNADDDDDYSLRGLSEVLSRASRQMYRENNLYADPARVALSSCHDLLSSSEDAARIMKEVHRTKTYKTIFDHSVFLPEILRQPRTAVGTSDAITAEIESVLHDSRARMQAIADGSRTYETWQPLTGDPAHAAHVASLKIPENQGLPMLVLHDIGRMINEDVLRQRLSKIFDSEHDTFFVNTSGSGKTRLLYEGLAHNWGLYLTAKVDSSYLGSTSVDYVTARSLLLQPDGLTVIPHPTAPNYTAVFVMREFLRLVDEHDLQHVHKARWLQCQLQSVTLGREHSDPFRAITAVLIKASSEYIEHALEQVLGDIRRRLGNAHLFVALDESQALGNDDGPDKSKYGLPRADAPAYLRRLILAWRGRPGVSLIVTGTELPKEIWDVEPLEMEYGKYRWCSATGAFDSKDSNRCYLLRYLPSAFVRTRSGQKLIRRLGFWLRGRHRLTASYIAVYIRFGTKQPHQSLNDYVHNGTGYLPHDADDLSVAEGPRYETAKRILRRHSLYSMRHPLIKSTVHRSLFSIFVHPSSVCRYDYRHVCVVTEALGRFVDDDACHIAIDEPYLLVTCAHWFRTSATDFLDLDYLRLRLLTDHPRHVAEFRSEVLAYLLARKFENKIALRDVFDFVGTPPSWANARTANLLLLHNTSKGRTCARVYHFTRESSGTTSTLVTTAATSAELDNWLAHADATPFCILHRSSSISLLFTLRLSVDNKNVWVVLDSDPAFDELSVADIGQRIARHNPLVNFDSEQLDKMRNIPDPSKHAGNPPFFFAFASTITAPQADDAAGHAVAAVNVADLRSNVHWHASSEDLEQSLLRFILPDTTESSHPSAKRSMVEGSNVRTSKRRSTTQPTVRTLRPTTVQQRRSVNGR